MQLTKAITLYARECMQGSIFHNDSLQIIAHRGTIQKYHTVPAHGRVEYVLPTAKCYVLSLEVKIGTTKIYTKSQSFLYNYAIV